MFTCAWVHVKFLSPPHEQAQKNKFVMYCWRRTRKAPVVHLLKPQRAWRDGTASVDLRGKQNAARLGASSLLLIAMPVRRVDVVVHDTFGSRSAAACANAAIPRPVPQQLPSDDRYTLF